jgi:hypothetical protein
MYAISRALGFRFTKPQIQRGIYSPRAHSIADVEHQIIRRGAAMVLSGNQGIKMDVTAFPASDDAVNLQRDVQEALLDTLTKQRVLKVHIVGEDETAANVRLPPPRKRN